MFLGQLLQPAILIINKLTFKYKILAIVSILLTLLIFPSITYINSFLQKHEQYKKQEKALCELTQIHELITQVQMHRGMVNAYLYGKKHFKEKILKIESIILKKSENFLKKNKKTLVEIHQIKQFQTIQTNLKYLFLKNLNTQSDYPIQIFNRHTDIINALIAILQKSTDYYGFGISENLTMKHLSKILTDKLLFLQENTGITRGLTTGILSQRHITNNDKHKLISLTSHISILQKTPFNQETKHYLLQFPVIKQTHAMMMYRLNNLLYILRQNILQSKEPHFKAEHFFQLASDTIDAQHKLYHLLIDRYGKILQIEQQKHMHYTIGLIIGFLIILLSALYLATAFYYAVTQSIKKLQLASALIARGSTNIEFISDTEDEVKDALAAFQKMSKKLNENISFLNSYKTAIDKTSIVSKTDTKGIITYANKKFCTISGYSKEELLGKPHNIVRHNEMPEEAFKDMWQTIKSGNIWHGIVKNRTKDGGFYIVDTMIMPICNTQGKIVEYIGIRHDITELEQSRKKIQEEMQKQKIDSLTNLPNKLQLLQDLKKLKTPVLLYLNINDFASLNDFYGTKVGDKVLVYVADLLFTKYTNKSIRLYKLSSDTFVLLFEDKDIVHSAEILIQEVIDYVEYKTSICSAKDCIEVTLSGGIATHHDGDNETLLSYASLARKFAKKENKNFLHYNPELNKDEDYEKNIAWINKIKDAIYEDRITTFYQPIVNNQTGKISKYETLMRLVEKSGKTISPFFFLEIAKKAKLYTKLTKIVFDKAFETFQEHPEIEFSINISIEDIADEEIKTHIFNKLKTFPHPNKVILEITEDQEITDYTQINNFIQKAKKLGAKIAIDDFGSGYANFDHIIKLNADYIKIDGSLIKNIDTDKESLIITQAIIAFSKKLGSQTVVEFVHNEKIHKIVKELGAEYSQGYYLGEPLPEILEEVWEL